MEYYERIRARRKELRMSQETLAVRTGYSGKSMVARIEKGEIDIPQNKVRLFCDALGVTPNWLLLGRDGEYLSAHERKLIEAYRTAPTPFKKAVDDLLQLD